MHFVVTNKRSSAAERLLEHFRLAPYLEGVVGQPETGEPLPKAELAGRCLASAGLDPATTVVVGDSDQDAAMAAVWSMTFIAVTSGAGPLGHAPAGAERVEVDEPDARQRRSCCAASGEEVVNRDIFEDLFVLELANNHWGSVERGLKIITAFSQVVRFNNVRAAIKLQFRDVDRFIHEDFRDRTDIRYIKKTLDTQMSAEDYGAPGRGDAQGRLRDHGHAVRRGLRRPVPGARRPDPQDRQLATATTGC